MTNEKREIAEHEAQEICDFLIEHSGRMHDAINRVRRCVRQLRWADALAAIREART